VENDGEATTAAPALKDDYFAKFMKSDDPNAEKKTVSDPFADDSTPADDSHPWKNSVSDPFSAPSMDAAVAAYEGSAPTKASEDDEVKRMRHLFGKDSLVQTSATGKKLVSIKLYQSN